MNAVQKFKDVKSITTKANNEGVSMPPSLPAANTHRQIQFLGRIQIKRRTHLARVYCKEPSLLRLITALLCETSQDWETEKLHQHANTTLSFFLILVHFTGRVLRVLFLYLSKSG